MSAQPPSIPLWEQVTGWCIAFLAAVCAPVVGFLINNKNQIIAKLAKEVEDRKANAQAGANAANSHESNLNTWNQDLINGFKIQVEGLQKDRDRDAEDLRKAFRRIEELEESHRTEAKYRRDAESRNVSLESRMVIVAAERDLEQKRADDAESALEWERKQHDALKLVTAHKELVVDAREYGALEAEKIVKAAIPVLDKRPENGNKP